MKIKKLNSLYLLIEGLDANFDFAQADIDAQNAGEIEGKSKKFQKQIAKGKKTSEGETLKEIQSIIEKWDPQGLTKNFRSILISRFAAKGLNSGDIVIKWLAQTEDANIKALDVASAKTLFDLLDDKDLNYNDPYILEGNNLFSGSSKDISYKLNVLNIVSNPRSADKYKNDDGKTPTMDLIYQEGKFLDVNQIKKNLDGFVTSEASEYEDGIPFLTWARIMGKAPQGKEWGFFKSEVSSLYRGNQHKELRSKIFSDLRELGKNYPQKLKNLGLFKVPEKGNIQTVIPLMVDAIQNKEYDAVRGDNKLVLYALLANLNDKDWNQEEAVYSPKNLKLILDNLLQKDPQASKYQGMVKILITQPDLIKKFINSKIPNTKLETLIKYTKKFIDDNIKVA